MTAVLEAISVWAIPVVIAAVSLYAICKKVPVYSVFTEGAKEGFSTAIMIIPYLVAMLCAIGMLRASGALDWFCNLIAPITNLIDLPSEVLPMGIMRSFSGGGAEGMMAELLKTYGTQSQIGRIASVALGSTETTFLYCSSLLRGNRCNQCKTVYCSRSAGRPGISDCSNCNCKCYVVLI